MSNDRFVELYLEFKQAISPAIVLVKAMEDGYKEVYVQKNKQKLRFMVKSDDELKTLKAFKEVKKQVAGW